MSKKSYYEILGVEKDATPEEIKKAYRRAAQKFHPDRNLDDPSAEEKFKEAKEAYDVLSSPTLRSQYDRTGTTSQNHGGWRGAGSSFEDVINAAREAFHAAGGGIMRQQVGIPIDIMLRGGSYKVKVLVPQSSGAFGPMRLSERFIDLDIEKNTPPGTTVVLDDGESELVLILVPQSSNGFMVHGIDIVTKVSINVLDAMTGTTINVKHPDGTKLRGEIQPGTENGTPLRIRGRGLAHPLGGQGDFIVVVEHEMPKLTPEQIKLVKELSEKLK